MKSRNYSIEFLRVIFTLYIVLRHTLAASGFYRVNCLWLGVEFFFVLSGFLLTMTFRPERSVGSYRLSRYMRFLPLTVLGCALCVAFAKPTPMGFVANALLIQETGIMVTGESVNPPTWYLSVLLWGGVIYLMLLGSDRRLRDIALVTIVLLGFSSLRKYGYEPVFGEMGGGIVSHRFIRGMSEMGLGCIVALCYPRIANLNFGRKSTTIMETVFFALAIIGPFTRVWRHPEYISLLVMVDAMLIVLFFMKRGWWSELLDRPIWGRISQYTLALFCTHYVTTFAIGCFCSNCGVGIRASVAVGAIALSVVLSVLARKFVEIPCANKLQAVMQKIKGA